LAKRKFHVFATPNVIKVLNALSDHDPLMIKVNQVTDEMKQDKNLGDYIKKKPWPEKYIKMHDVTNLYRREIGGNHSLIYTIRGRKEDKVYQLLDLLSHKEYDRLFGYSTT
jgi:hypothetical protein